jgi:hypothetical protein
METSDKVVIQIKATSILISWKELPIEWKVGVLWRGEYFTIHIKATKTQFGETRVINFKYNGKEYPCTFIKYKYNGGSTPVYPPHIETQSHSLKISTALRFFEMTDVPRTGSASEEYTNPFMFIYQS